MNKQTPIVLTCAVLVGILPQRAHSQWSNDPSINNPISRAANLQASPAITGDGTGGAIIVWYDTRNDLSGDIYAQHIDSTGVILWGADGAAISIAPGEQAFPKIIGDGTGGAIITWQGGGDIYAQRINHAGVVQWAADGVVIISAAHNQSLPRITSDGAGGAIIVWQDSRNGLDDDIYAQRINNAGEVQWADSGEVISTAGNSQYFPTISTDDANGAIITWQDYRSNTDGDIYAQRINGTGVVMWTSDGVAISTSPYDQEFPQLTIDGSGGAIITWEDLRNGIDDDIYAQHIDSAGVVEWTSNGVAISTATQSQGNPTIINDASGGAIIAWHDARNVTSDDIYAQRVDANGAVHWTTNGTPIATGTSEQVFPTIATDGEGGAVISWGEAPYDEYMDIHAQRIDSTGLVHWTTNGIAVSTAPNPQENPTLIGDGIGGAIITWRDSRDGFIDSDIYAQKVNRYGYLGTVDVKGTAGELPESFSLLECYPNPFNPNTTISFDLPRSAHIVLSVYTLLGEKVATMVNERLGAGKHTRVFEARDLSSGVYLYRLSAEEFSATRKMVLVK